jgi:drug/metabolite transporter (DMT)-like permease
MMLPLALIIDSPWSLSPSLEAVAAVFGIALISTVLAYLLYFRILAAAGATNVLLVTFLIPISALLLGVGVLGEVIKALEYIGMACIFLGLIVIDGRVLKWIKIYFNFRKKAAYLYDI